MNKEYPCRSPLLAVQPLLPVAKNERRRLSVKMATFRGKNTADYKKSRKKLI